MEKLIINPVSKGISQIDAFYLGQEGITSCYMIEDNNEIGIIETSTNHAVPILLGAVKHLGFELQQVKYVIVTHIHLDHAGGAGQLLTHLPEAELVLHARGQKHMVNPEKLVKGAKQVYGEEKYSGLYGEIIPVKAERVRAVNQRDTLSIGNRKLELIESPGHARHHLFVFDPLSRSVFSGDAFGLSYPRFSFENFRLVFPSTSPVQFDPEEAMATYKKIADLNPSRILFTHAGSVEDIDDAHRQLNDWIEFSVEITEKRYTEGLREKELHKTLLRDIQTRFNEIIYTARGKGLSDEEKEFLFLDCDLNAQGLVHYIQMQKVGRNLKR